jgi:hypothetical protein
MLDIDGSLYAFHLVEDTMIPYWPLQSPKSIARVSQRGSREEVPPLEMATRFQFRHDFLPLLTFSSFSPFSQTIKLGKVIMAHQESALKV